MQECTASCSPWQHDVIVPYVSLQLRTVKASQEREVDRLLTQALSEKEANLSDLEKRLAQEAK